MNKLILVAILSTLVSSCGTVGNVTRSDSSITKKLAKSLNVAPDKIVVSDKKTEGNKIKYIAEVNGETFKCEEEIFAFGSGGNKCYIFKR